MNKPAYIVTNSSVSVIWDGKPYTVSSDNPSYQGLMKCLLNANWEDIPNFLSIEKTIVDFSHGNISIREGKIFAKNRELHGVVVDKLLQFLRQGSKDAEHLLNFIDRLFANPSANSVEQLYTFLGYKNLPITEKGFVIGYRGVQNDWYSRSGNASTVVIQGKTNQSFQIYNGVGETIEVARNCVDDNKSNHCSHGLHVGSYDYAKNWAGSDGRVVMVEFDPADAVSVPTDCDFQKLRVSKYKVIGEIPQEKISSEAPLNEASYDTSCEIDIEDETDSCCDKNDANCTVVHLAIKNYLKNQHEKGHLPTLKQIQSRMKGFSLTCAQIKTICEQLGFLVQANDEATLSNWVVDSEIADSDLDLDI